MDKYKNSLARIFDGTDSICNEWNMGGIATRGEVADRLLEVVIAEMSLYPERLIEDHEEGGS